MHSLTHVRRAILIAIGVSVFLVGLHAQERRREDCHAYDPAKLSVREDVGDNVWVVTREDGARFNTFASKLDAEFALSFFREHTQVCYIGRDNQRSNHERYVMQYWK